MPDSWGGVRDLPEDQGTLRSAALPTHNGSWQSGCSINKDYYFYNRCCYNGPTSWLVCPLSYILSFHPSTPPLESLKAVRTTTHLFPATPTGSHQGDPCRLSSEDLSTKGRRGWEGVGDSKQTLSASHPTSSPAFSRYSLSSWAQTTREEPILSWRLQRGAGSHSLGNGATCRPLGAPQHRPLKSGWRGQGGPPLWLEA